VADTANTTSRHWLLGALRQIAWLDWLMLLLALVSIGLLGYETWGPVSAADTAGSSAATT